MIYGLKVYILVDFVKNMQDMTYVSEYQQTFLSYCFRISCKKQNPW